MGFEPQKDPLLRASQRLILISVRALVVLMTLVIVWGVADVVWVLFERLRQPPVMLLTITVPPHSGTITSSVAASSTARI